MNNEKKKKKKLVSEPKYQTTKHFSENLLPIEMKKTEVTMNKLIYLWKTLANIIY